MMPIFSVGSTLGFLCCCCRFGEEDAMGLGGDRPGDATSPLAPGPATSEESEAKLFSQFESVHAVVFARSEVL